MVNAWLILSLLPARNGFILAAKPAAPAQATAPVQSAAAVAQAKPVAAQPAPAQSLATATAAPMPANRPRGSILNITV